MCLRFNAVFLAVCLFFQMQTLRLAEIIKGLYCLIKNILVVNVWELAVR